MMHQNELFVSIFGILFDKNLKLQLHEIRNF